MYIPQSIDEFIGQRNAVAPILTVIEAAMERETACPHMIFYGPPGVGKTAIGNLISGLMGSKMHYCIGKTFNLEKEMMRLDNNDIVFIDEVHRLPSAIEEQLYEPLDTFNLTITGGLYREEVPLPPFTFIGSTTLLGKISKPLRDRCRLNIHFKLYTKGDLTKIVLQAADKNSMVIDEDGASDIAKMSRGTPRIALRILAMATDVSVNNKTNVISESILRVTKQLMELYPDGLDENDVKYMRVLLDSDRPIGQKAIAKTLGVDEGTVSEVIEPFLVENGYIILSDTGRILTRKGLDRIRSDDV